MTLNHCLFAAVFCGTLFGGPAISQATCDQRTAVVEQLREQYQEQRTATGLLNDGAVVELFTSAKGSFTVIVTTAFGLSCVTLLGSDWERKDGKVFELEHMPAQQVH